MFLCPLQGATVTYHEAKAWPGAPTGVQPRKTLFLLHGAAFNAETWTGFSGRRIPTVQTLSSAGFNVIAVNLPGNTINT